MNILNWNYQGLNSTRKRHILHDLIVDHSVDLVLVQETKKRRVYSTLLKQHLN